MRRRSGGALALAAVGAIAVLIATVNGLMVSADSFVYATSAESLRDGRGYTIDGDAVIPWPVGYPALLAAGGWLVDVFTFARILNAVGFSAAVWLGARVARQLGGPGVQEIWSAALVASFSTLFLSALALLSELVFTVLILAVALELAGDRWPGARVLRLGVVLGALCLVRWAGVSVVAAAALAMWFAPGAFAVRVKRMAAVGLVGAAPLVAGALRNQAASGSPLGNRGPGDIGVLELGNQLLTAIGASVLRHGSPLHLLTGVVLTALAVIVLVQAFIATDQHRRVALIPIAYLSFITVSRYRTLFDDLKPGSTDLMA